MPGEREQADSINEMVQMQDKKDRWGTIEMYALPKESSYCLAPLNKCHIRMREIRFFHEISKSHMKTNPIIQEQ